MNHCGPLPFRELHSTIETMMLRNPGGSWAWLPPVYKCNHPATYVDYASNSTIRREEPYETLKDQNHKNSWDLGKRSIWKRPKRKHLEWKEPSEMLNRGKPLITIAGPKRAKEKALKWTSQTGKEPMENHSEKNKALLIAKKSKTSEMKF